MYKTDAIYFLIRVDSCAYLTKLKKYIYYGGGGGGFLGNFSPPPPYFKGRYAPEGKFIYFPTVSLKGSLIIIT